MASKKCLICSSSFSGRRDAKTCSMRCRKRLQLVRISLTTPKKHLVKTLSLFILMFFGVASLVLSTNFSKASAATSSNLNFQSRLLTSTGAVVADGNYNIEFKIYNASSSSGSSQGSCSGDANCLWTETRTSTNKVRVVNGYMSVNLGSVTSFPAINWDQQMYLTMNIGGTGAASWDGEMNPRITLTALPYSFYAGQLASGSGSSRGTLSIASLGQATSITLPDPGAGTATVCYQSATACGFAPGTSSSYIQNGTSVQTSANFNIDTTGKAGVSFLSPLFDAQSSNGALGLGSSNAGAITIGNVTNSTVTVKTKSSTTAFQVQNASARSLLNVDSTGNIVSIGNTTDGSQITLAANGNANGTIRKNMNVTGTVNANEIVEIDTGNAGKVQQAAINSSKVFGVATSTATNAAEDIVISGVTQVSCNGSVNIGDLLASSGTAGQVASVTSGSTAAIGTVVGRALSTCSSSLVWAQLTIGAGGQDTLQSAYNNSTSPATITSTDNKNIVFNMADTSTDSSFLVNLQCATSCGANGKFAVQSAGTDVLSVAPNGGNISLGVGGFANTIQIGNTTGAVAQTINIGNNTTGSANTTTVLGSTIDGSTTTIQAGTGNLNLSPSGSSNTGVVVKPANNSTAAFQIQNAAGSQLLNVDNATTPNLLSSNPDFEASSVSSWVGRLGTETIARTTSQAWQGNAALSVTEPASAAANAGTKYVVSLSATTTYALSAYIKTQTGSIATFAIGRAEDGATDSNCSSGNTVSSGGWTRLTCTFTTGDTAPSSSYIYIKDTAGNVSKVWYVDGVQLESRANLLTNPGAESALGSEWAALANTNAPVRSTTAGHFNSGAAGIDVTPTTTGTNRGIKSVVTLSSFTTYTFSIYARNSSGTAGSMEIGRSEDGAAFSSCSSGNSISASFAQFSCTFTTGATSGSTFVYIRDANSRAAAAPFYVDTAQLWVGTISSAVAFQDGQIAINGVVNSPVSFRNQSDSTTAFQVQNASGVNFIQVDTSGANLYLGNTGIATNVTVGSGTSTSTTTIQGGTGNINITPNGSSNTGVVVKPTNNSTAAFQVQNATGGNLMQIDSTNSNITVNGANNGLVQAWQTSANTLTTGVDSMGTLTVNGYVYVLGGIHTGTDTAAVQYAQLQANGNVGAWGTTTSLPAARDDAGYTTWNGYVYVIGGSTNDTAANAQSTVYYAKVNQNGTISNWNTNSYALGCATAGCGSPVVRYSPSAFAYNGYLYLTGGANAAGTDQTTVYYAKINADGSTGAWNTTTAISGSGTTQGMEAFIANGYMYADRDQANWSKINSDGTLGSWTGGGSAPTSLLGAGTAVMNGYLYMYGGFKPGGSVSVATTYYAQINSSTGAIGSWSCQGASAECVTTPVNTNAMPLDKAFFGGSTVEANGYMYAIGGTDGASENTVYYTSTARTSIAGSLDLVGVSVGANGNLAEGDTGGQLTAGDTSIVGTLNVQNQANFNNGVGINGLLGISGSETIQNTSNSLTNFSVLNGSSVNLISSSTVNLIKNSSFESGTTGVDNNVSGWSKKLGSETSLEVQNNNAYFGSNSMQIVTTTTAQQGAKYLLPGLLPSTQYTFSFYALLSTSSFATLTAGRSDTGVSGGETNCTLNSPHGTSNSTITTIYQRYDCTFTTGATLGASGTPYVYISKGANASIRTIYIDGVQLETASAPTDFRNGDITIDSLATFKSTATSTTAFQVQNATGGNLLKIDTANSSITVNGANNGQIQSWQTGNNSGLGAKGSYGSVFANGYVYIIGGCGTAACVSSTSTVQYAKLLANGNVGNWASTTSLPANRDDMGVAYANGYIYVVGGSNNDTNAAGQTTVYYTKVNPDGTLGAWNTSSNSLPTASGRYQVVSTAYNGYLYAVGGSNPATGNMATVYYAKINADGTTSTWNTTSSLATAMNIQPSIAVANGYIYTLSDSNLDGNKDQYAKLNSDGTIGAWALTTGLTPVANNVVGGATAIANGYIYYIGGDSANGTATRTIFAPLNANGTIGAWSCQGPLAECTTATQINTTALPADREFMGSNSMAANGYIYIIGGYDTSNNLNSTVYYTSTARTSVGGSLDLLGTSLGANGNLAEGDSGGQLTAGDTTIVGTLSVQNQASFNNGVSVNGGLSVSGSATFQNQAGSTTAFQVQNASGINNISITTADLVGNSDFESGTTGQSPSGWASIGTNSTLTVDNSQADFGTNSMKDVTSTNTNAGAKYNYPLLASTQYTLSFYSKVLSGSITDVQAGRADDGSTNTNCFGGGQTVTTTWTRFSCTFTTGATISGTPYIFIYKTGASAETFWIDGVQLEQAAAASTYTAGNIKLDGQITFKNTANSTTAFQVQDAGAVNLFAIDTTNRVITISGDTTTFANLTLTNAHFKSTQTTAPTIGTPTNCATSPTATVTSGSSDSAGSFIITTGTGGGQTTCDTVITFNKAYGAAPKTIVLQPTTAVGSATGLKSAQVSATSTTTFTVKLTTNPAGAGEVNGYYYWIVE
jgi:hypothetical protein